MKMKVTRQARTSSINATSHSQRIDNTNLLSIPRVAEHKETHLKVPTLSVRRAGSAASICKAVHQRAKQEVIEDNNSTKIELYTPEGIYLGNRHIKSTSKKPTIEQLNTDTEQMSNDVAKNDGKKVSSSTDRSHHLPRHNIY